MGNVTSEVKPIYTGVAPADRTYRANSDIHAKQYTNVRAVVIGIGYDKTSYKLSGTRNDAEAMANFLTQRFPDNLTLLKLNDAPGASINTLPTKKNLDLAMRFLCSSAPVEDYGKEDYAPLRESTLLILYYSGHGSQVIDWDGDERDGEDETLCFLTDDCLDVDNLVDDDINHKYLKMIPALADLVVVFDCCHSGSSLDLRYKLRGNTFVNAGVSYSDTPFQVYYLGGTIDSLCSYEKNGKGYFTEVLISILNKHRNLSLHSLSLMLNAELRKLISPSLQTVAIESGQLISSQQQFPL